MNQNNDIFNIFYAYTCPHCKKIIKNEKVIAIVSGTVAAVHVDSDGYVFGDLTDINNSKIFHEECFLEIAGKEYFPKTKEALGCFKEVK